MKTYRLITLDPLKLYTKSLNGLPSSLVRETLPPPAPTGYKYVEDLAKPTEDPADGFVWTRNLTADEYGWAQTAAPPAPDPEWYEQPAWRIRAIADVTPHGGGMLIDSCTAAIDAIVDPTEKAIAKEVFFGGNTLRRDSALLTSMAAGLGLTDAELDTLFQQAEAIVV
jgi:hypothetical protein